MNFPQGIQSTTIGECLAQTTVLFDIEARFNNAPIVAFKVRLWDANNQKITRKIQRRIQGELIDGARYNLYSQSVFFI